MGINGLNRETETTQKQTDRDNTEKQTNKHRSHRQTNRQTDKSILLKTREENNSIEIGNYEDIPSK